MNQIGVITRIKRDGGDKTLRVYITYMYMKIASYTYYNYQGKKLLG